MKVRSLSRRFAALGDERRLAIVQELTTGDLAVDEIAVLVDMSGNLLAHHLGVLESAGLIVRTTSEGDRRRRYVAVDWSQLPLDLGLTSLPFTSVAFVCSHNSARSQFAAALWEERTGRPSFSAGSDPSPVVHPRAVTVAKEFGVDISAATPGGYERITTPPDLLIGVCDRAWEAGVPPARRLLHWSVPDPVEPGTRAAFRSAFSDLSRRIDHLAKRIATTR
jgi:protein-tyrosine-phosphatase/DNA-binding transcriptional ArsR family regulator